MSAKLFNLCVVLVAICTVVFTGWVLLDESPPAPNYVAEKWVYPLDYELHHTVNQNDVIVKLVHRVSYDETEQEYIYYYRIEHTGRSILFQWDVLDIAHGKRPLLYDLKDGQIQEITIRSQSPPKLIEGSVHLFGLDENSWEPIGVQEGIKGPIPEGAE